MKPVNNKNQPYSILLMRDDTAVRTLTAKGSVFTVFFVFLFLLMLGGAIGIWGGIRYWKKYDAMSESYKRQERELSEARLQLERYVNYETVLEAANGTPPTAKNEEIVTIPPVVRTHNATQANLPPAQNSTSPATAALAKIDRNATMPQYNASAATAATAVAPVASQAAQSSLPLISSDASPLRISNFVGRIVSSQRMRVRYELSTASPEDQKTVSGTAKYFVVSSDDTEVELPVQDIGDSRFAILRMKPMEASLRIPPSLNLRDVSQIRVSLEVDGGKVFNGMFPLIR